MEGFGLAGSRRFRIGGFLEKAYRFTPTKMKEDPLKRGPFQKVKASIVFQSLVLFRGRWLVF